jgi:hypothetical protein
VQEQHAAAEAAQPGPLGPGQHARPPPHGIAPPAVE